MGRKLVQETNLQNIAAAIRAKNGSSSTYKPREMADAIRALPSAGTLVPKAITENGSYSPQSENADGYSSVTVNVGRYLGNKSITRNGTFRAASDHVDGYSSVSVNVPNSYSALDEGKVVSSGALSEQTSRTVTQNGTFDTTRNNQVTVNVSDDTTLVSKTITANGTYDPADDNADGYSSVSVAVPNSALTSADEGKVVVSGALMPQTSLSVNANGTYDTTAKNSVVVNVSGGGGGSSTILHGNTTPTSSQGQNGDIYLKTYSSSLPSGITQIEYIGSTGTQWIDTGYLGKANSKYVADVYIETSQPNYSPAAFGGRTSHVSKAATFFVLDFFAGQWADQEVRSGNITSTYKGIRSTIEMDQNGYIVTNANGDSVSFPFTTSTLGGTDYSVALFGTTSGSTSAGELIAMKLYRFSIYEGNTLVHDYIPCRNAYNLAGLCDVVTGTLFTNGGSGNFSLGNDVSGGTHQYVSNAFLKRSGEWEPLIGADISGIL